MALCNKKKGRNSEKDDQNGQTTDVTVNGSAKRVEENKDGPITAPDGFSLRQSVAYLFLYFISFLLLPSVSDKTSN